MTSIADFLSSRESEKGDPHIGAPVVMGLTKANMKDIESTIHRVLLMHKAGDVAASWLTKPKDDKSKKDSLLDKMGSYTPMAAPIVLVADFKRSVARSPKTLLKAITKK